MNETELTPAIPEDAKQALMQAMGALKEQTEEVLPNLPVEGKDLNLQEWEVPPGTEHLYRRAKLNDDNKYVVEIKEYLTESRNYGGGGKNSIAKDGTPQNLGEYITFMINGPEGWQLFNVLPNGSGLGCAVFVRVVRHPLPMPVLLKTVEATPPSDAELDTLADQTQKWAAEQGAPEAQ